MIAPEQFDNEGNPVVVPAWWRGTAAAFTHAVAQLKPHHCSYPDGQRKDPHKLIPCHRKKNAYGACDHHASELLPRVHSASLTNTEADRMIRGITDPKLTDLYLNVYYAEEILKRSALRCTNGGLSQRLVKLIRSLVEKGRRHRDGFAEAIEMPRDTKEQAALRGKALQESIDGLGEAIEAIDRAIDLHERDESHWATFAKANRESIDIKGKAASIAAERQQTISHEEMNRSIQSLLLTIEDSIKSSLSPDESDRALTAMFMGIREKLGPSAN